jgi:hypothetical protein
LISNVSSNSSPASKSRSIFLELFQAQAKDEFTLLAKCTLNGSLRIVVVAVARNHHRY